jgi:DNA-binding MarR family transcriptional regulator
MDKASLSASPEIDEGATQESSALAGETVSALLDVLPRLGRVLKSHMGGSGITPQQMHLLLAVGELARRTGEGAQPGELSRRCWLSSPAITAAVDDLVEQGLCARTHSEKDRRKVLVRLTPTGQQALQEARSAATTSLAGLLTGWDEGRIREFLGMLRELDRSAELMLGAEHG